MKLEALPAIKGDYNLNNYEETYNQFDWKETEQDVFLV